MDRKTKRKRLILFGSLLILLLIGIILTNNPNKVGEPVKELMKDVVLHESAKVRLPILGLPVNPGLVSAYTVTIILLVFALAIRLFIIPKFSDRPGKLQIVLEEAAGLFNGMAVGNSPHRNRFLGGYIFAAGAYICLGTLFELFGFQAVTTQGLSTALPAPLSDINGAISLGVFSYSVILVGGVVANGVHGGLQALKDFSLPVSMSFRLFGALLSGALVTELVYHYLHLSFVLPVIVGVLFTLLHALIQAYVLTMLTSVFYGESTEPRRPKLKKKKESAAA